MSRFLARCFGVTKASARRRHHGSVSVEALEVRTVLAASIALVGSQLQIHGTDNADIITITSVQPRLGPARIDVVVLDTQNRATFVRSFDPALVSSLRVEGHAGNDSITNNTALHTDIFGGTGDDLLIGGSAFDAIWGGAGVDSIYGRTGDDDLHGGAPTGGSDQGNLIFGGIGNDMIRGGDADDILVGESGNDTIEGYGGHDVIVGDFGITSVDRPGMKRLSDVVEVASLGTSGKDELDGGGGDDTLFGGAGDDRLFGSGGNDSLYGNEGQDLLGGGTGDDMLVGGLNQDTLVGGEGFDDLVGGEGLDFYYYDLLDSIDNISALFMFPTPQVVVGPFAGYWLKRA